MNSYQILVQAKKILESGMTDSGKVREVLRLIRENEKTGTKVCATCGLEKSVAAFNVVKSSNNGKPYLRNTCKRCNNRKRNLSRKKV